MHEEIIFSGFGGQGALFAGQLLAYAALDFGLQVTWIPSYGPEMRGGTAHCTVIVSDEAIGSPLVRRPASVVALNLPSFEKYEPLVKPGGLLVYNESLIPARPSRTDIRYVAVPANVIAEEWATCAGQRGVARRLPGRYRAAAVGSRGVALGHHLSDRQRRFLASNKQALRRGASAPSDRIPVRGPPRCRLN